MPADQPLDAFWSLPAADVLRQLGASPEGLSGSEAQRRLATYGFNQLKPRKKAGMLGLLARQFTSPIVLILIAAAVLSLFLHDPTDAAIILVIVVVSGLLGFWQERGAEGAVERLLAMVQVKAEVLRGGQAAQIPIEAVVPGDVARLSAGGVVPGDCLLLEANNLFVDEAALTGETFPVEKKPGPVPPETPLIRRAGVLFMGTHVVSGSARALVVQTGAATEFGKVSERLTLRPEETAFEHGIRRFGYLLLEITLLLVVLIFAANVYLQKPVLDSFLFSLALAVGLTPQLLPAIISINLAHGARRMAEQKVIVKRLSSIENFGSMNVLCSDKTGTLTEGVVHVQAAQDVDGQDSEAVRFHAFLNAAFESGFSNPIDEAIRAHRTFPLDGYRKLDEVPYDFVRKRLSVLVQDPSGKNVLVTKGALQNVLNVCATAQTADGTAPLASVKDRIAQRYEQLSSQGLRTLGVAAKATTADHLSKEDEADLAFLGFLVLADPPKAGIAETVAELRRLGVALKMITGDNHLVARTVGRQVGLTDPNVLTGSELRQMSDAALIRRAGTVDVFAEVEPNQKERIILALKKAGEVVGYLGDGINDAPALHAADVGLSVNTAVDVAKEAADFVLLEHDLGVLVEGVREGRRTFANTLKYVFMATSANFGNMFSMAGASLFLPFLPLLPKQILLTNLMTDFPEIAIASDHVDAAQVERPRRWDIGFIRRFMLTFGVLSSVFDYLTFGVLLWLLHANVDQFRTGWFVESVVSATLIVLVIRTRQPFFRSRPSRWLLGATLAVGAVVLALPYTPVAGLLGFAPLPPLFLLVLAGIVVVYIAAAEMVKRWFYRAAERRR